MIQKREIDDVLLKYDPSRVKIGTLCSHSALQIFHGAKQEGLRTVGICPKERKSVYEAFPQARPTEFILIDAFQDIMDPAIQEQLIQRDVIIIPHGSFVEYVGAMNLERNFMVPMFGNRASLEWESDRRKQRQWLERAGLKLPKGYKSPSDIDSNVIVKFSGAKGGAGFFITSSTKDFEVQIERRMRRGLIVKDDVEKIAIQELIPGVRYYPHYFQPAAGLRNSARIELLGMDRRLEVIDESYRWSGDRQNQESLYTVTGNQPAIVRESLLPEIIEIGENTVRASNELFPPGMMGPFSLETIYSPERGFTVFEISARIVAGTNLFPQGSSYSFYLYKEPMSMGRRIAREIKVAARKHQLSHIAS